jgi:hypothetical protein
MRMCIIISCILYWFIGGFDSQIYNNDFYNAFKPATLIYCFVCFIQAIEKDFSQIKG